MNFLTDESAVAQLNSVQQRRTIKSNTSLGDSVKTAMKCLLVVGLFLTALVPKAEAGSVYTQVGPGFIFAGGSAPGVSASFLGRITRSSPAFFGIDTGAFFTSGGTFGLNIPLVPYLVYYFPTRDLFKPWLGFGFGAMLGFGGGTNSDFVIFFKPGVRMSINRQVDLFIETRLGLIGPNLAFAPTVGAMFEI